MEDAGGKMRGDELQRGVKRQEERKMYSWMLEMVTKRIEVKGMIGRTNRGMKEDAREK